MSLNQSDDRQSQPDASASIDDYHSEPDGKGIRDDSQTGSFDQVKPARMTFKEFEAKEYNMKHKHTGRAIVINNKHFRGKIRNSDKRTRENTDEDRDAIKEVLKTLGFVGINYKDQKTNETKQEMIFENVQKEELLKLLNDAGDDTINKYDDMDCFICVILSYGEPGVVYCPGANNTDRDDLVELKKLMEPLKGNRCRGLLMKPKLFFIQGCLYEYYDEADYGKTETKKEIIKKVPVEADFLIQSCHLDASFGKLSQGTTKTSLFIRALCNALQTFCIDEMKNSREKRSLHFLTVLTRVNGLVARFMPEVCKISPDNKYQIPLVTSLLTKHMYFYAKNK